MLLRTMNRIPDPTISPRTSPSRVSPAPAGFTLLEMLFVVAVLAILLSMLMPAVGRARSQAKTVVCASQLRQVYAAAEVWKASHDPQPLSAFGWRVNYRPYLQTSRIYRCPEDDNLGADDAAGVGSTSGTAGGGGSTGAAGTPGTPGTLPSRENLFIRIHPLDNYPFFDIPCAPGPWCVESDVTANSYDLWFENLAYKGGGDRDFNDVHLRFHDNGDGTMTVTTLAPISAVTPVDLMNGDNGQVIFPRINVQPGTPYGTSVTVGHAGAGATAGTPPTSPTDPTAGASPTGSTPGSPASSSYGLSNQIDSVLGRSDKVFGLDYLTSVANPSTDSWSDKAWLTPAGANRFARHRGQANVLFADGSIRLTPITKTNLDPAVGDNASRYWMPK